MADHWTHAILHLPISHLGHLLKFILGPYSHESYNGHVKIMRQACESIENNSQTSPQEPAGLDRGELCHKLA